VAAALTNEERFIVSCQSVGEADVRQKLGAGRFSERRAEWASNWLEQMESGKSDATRAEEKTSRLPKSANPKRYAVSVISVLLLLLVGGSIVLLKFA
jgi:hypothetical protein